MMIIYYKFTSAKEYSAVEIGGPFISVGSLKQLIFESKYQAKKSSGDSRADRNGGSSLCLGTDLDLQVTDARTNEKYVDDSKLIVANSRVLLRRVPGDRRRRPMDIAPIVAEPLKVEMSLASGSSCSGAASGSYCVTDDVVEDGDQWSHDFGEDVFALDGAAQAKSKNLRVAGVVEEDEDSKIKALVNTPALGCYVAGSNTVFSGGVKWMNGRGFGGMEGRTPHEGYVCRRCNVSGHFIQHCPTNGFPKYDFKRVKTPRGIPRSMLVANPDGSYKLPSGESAVLKPNEDAFDREMEGLSSSSRSSSVWSIPPELHCPLCKKVMKDAVLTSRCCFDSFCDKCIKDHLVNSKLTCVCGKSNVLADYLIPNMTLRDAIKRMLETGSCSSSSGDNATSVPRFQEINSACHRSGNANVFSPEQSAVSSIGRKRALPGGAGVFDQVAKTPRSAGATDVSEAQSVSAGAKKTSSETETKRRKTKASHQQEAGGCTMQTGLYAYDSYWNGMQPWMQGCVDPYGNALQYNAYGMNSFGLAYPYDQGYMVPPQSF